MKLVFKLLLLDSHKNLESYNFIQTSSETFRVYVFLTFSQRVLPSHRREACVKKPQVSVGDRKAEK